MKVLVAGGSGQLGRALQRRGRDAHVVVAPPDADFNITEPAQIERALASHSPDVVINAAAYTAVDRAETERSAAFAVNRDGAGLLANACAAARVPMLHISTDYVFDGNATRPYREDDPIAPLGAYAESKAEGEIAAREAGATIVRTSWLFEQKGPSFVHTMLRLAAERPLLRVVADQRGCPTWADDLADALLALASTPGHGDVYHYCNDGETTWHAFAEAIIAEARTHRSLKVERIEAITTAEYPLPARRPPYSVLDTSRIRALGIVPPSWTIGLATVVREVLAS